MDYFSRRSDKETRRTSTPMWGALSCCRHCPCRHGRRPEAPARRWSFRCDNGLRHHFSNANFLDH